MRRASVLNSGTSQSAGRARRSSLMAQAKTQAPAPVAQPAALTLTPRIVLSTSPEQQAPPLATGEPS
jgi:hypothetical protein